MEVPQLEERAPQGPADGYCPQVLQTVLVLVTCSCHVVDTCESALTGLQRSEVRHRQLHLSRPGTLSCSKLGAWDYETFHTGQIATSSASPGPNEFLNKNA